MSMPSAVAGATRPTPTITWTRADGTVETLTGGQLTGRIVNPKTGEGRDIAGALAVADGAAGTFTWTYDAADVALSGTWWVQFTAAFGSGATPARTLATEWVVHPAY